jgi:hypothetical protein
MKLTTPDYQFRDGCANIGLAVESMRRHMTDEGWQLFQGLHEANYHLAGHKVTKHYFERDEQGRVLVNETDVVKLLEIFDPSVVVVQDKREWMGLTADKSQDPAMRFTNVSAMRDRHNVFKIYVLKDAHGDAELHCGAAEEIGIHAWICYYDLDTVARLSPWVRREHLIRTWHSVDAALVPVYSNDRPFDCLLSGAIGAAYPLRTRLWRADLPRVTRLQHPGYHRNGCATPRFLQTLSKYKVAICTASKYGYALRKIIEATACGCAVITDLPVTDRLPMIDDNLWRVPSDSTMDCVADLVRRICYKYDADKQRELQRAAEEFYDYRAIGNRLADDIEKMRKEYPCSG